MRIFKGTKVMDAPSGWRDAVTGHRVVIDVGSGDGRWAYESARADPRSVYVAVDPDSQALSEYAYKASRKPARGGVANVVFVLGSAEQLPPDLTEIADLVRVNFPWGSLLRGLIEPQPAVLSALASLLKHGGRFEIVATYVPEYDPNAFAGEPLPALDENSMAVLAEPFAVAGLAIESRRRLTQDEALAIPSTWGRRLLHARPRPVFFIEGSRI